MEPFNPLQGQSAGIAGPAMQRSEIPNNPDSMGRTLPYYIMQSIR